MQSTSGSTLEDEGSNSRIPGIAVRWRAGTQPVTDALGAVRHRHSGQILEILVSELTRYFQAERCAVIGGHLPPVHAVREQRLRMEGVRHVDAVPPFIEGEEENVL